MKHWFEEWYFKNRMDDGRVEAFYHVLQTFALDHYVLADSRTHLYSLGPLSSRWDMLQEPKILWEPQLCR